MAASKSCAHRQRFLKKKRKQSVQQYAIALYLAALMTVLLGLQTTVGDSLLFPLVTYALVSSFVVLVCATNSRCCSAHRTVYRPIPECINSYGTADSKAAPSDVIFVILDSDQTDDKLPLHSQSCH